MTEASAGQGLCRRAGARPLTDAETKIMWLYKTKLCFHFTQTGGCPLADMCLFAHSGTELRRNPTRYQYGPELCADPHCPAGKECKNSHNQLELLFHPANFKTSPCRIKTCPGPKFCPFIHATGAQGANTAAKESHGTRERSLSGSSAASGSGSSNSASTSAPAQAGKGFGVGARGKGTGKGGLAGVGNGKGGAETGGSAFGGRGNPPFAAKGGFKGGPGGKGRGRGRF